MIGKPVAPSDSFPAGPRSFSTETVRPSTARAAVAPRATITLGLIRRRSLFSHQRQACTSPALGFLWMPALAAQLVLEVLHRVGDVEGAARGRLGLRPGPCPKQPARRRDRQRGGRRGLPGRRAVRPPASASPWPALRPARPGWRPARAGRGGSAGRPPPPRPATPAR